MDLDAEMQTGRKQIKQIGQRERLSEETSFGMMRQSVLQGIEPVETGRNDQSDLL